MIYDIRIMINDMRILEESDIGRKGIGEKRKVKSEKREAKGYTISE